MTPSQAVIFDMDGVLVDSYHAHFESWNILAAETGCRYSREDFVAGFGRTSREVLAEQWPPALLATHSIEQLDSRKEQIFRGLIAADFPAMRGATALIKSLYNSGWLLAVGSSGPPENVAQVLASLEVESYIQARVTGADVTRGKPDPQVFRMSAERLNVPPSRCIVIEDAPAGVKAAHAAGMICVGLVSTGRTREDLADADLLVNELTDIEPATLGRLLERRRSA